MKLFKKLFICLMILSISLILVSCGNDKSDFKFKYNEEEKVATLTGYIGKDKKVIIPDNIEKDNIKYKVTSIGGVAFAWCSSLTSITIPESVTSIGVSAFLGCYRLVEVCNKSNLDIKTGSDDFPYVLNVYTPETGSSKLSIDHGYVVYTDDKDKILIAYRGKSNKLAIPNYITKINQHAFYRCSSLKSISIPDSVTSIGSSAFLGCSSLKSITIPSSVTSIGSSTFSGCSSLTSITIPSSVTSIGSSTFSGCSSLTSITIPNSVTSIGVYAFGECSSLESITIPDSVTSIGHRAFVGCSSITKVNVPASLIGYIPKKKLEEVTINSGTSIGDNAFINCSSLTSITIPDSVTSIGVRAFYNCSSLTSIIISDGVISIGEEAFSYCSSLTINCEAREKPAGWDDYWNPDNRPVNWGYKK